jgi:hypothetical protein
VSPLPSAALRVYQPLDAFDQDEEDHWRRYVIEDRAPSHREGPERERRLALLALARGRLPGLDGSGSTDPGDAYVRYVGDLPHVCPWYLPLRSAEMAREVQRELPTLLVEALLPRAVTDMTGTSLSEWRAAHPRARPTILTAPWVVPVHWFVLFEPTERLLGPGRDVVFLTEMSRARRRAERALSVLHRTMPEGPATATVGNLARWLEDFHPRALVELDYSGLASRMSEKDLLSDTSVEDIATGLTALGAGDGQAAMAAYERVVDRWRSLRLGDGAN